MDDGLKEKLTANPRRTVFGVAMVMVIIVGVWFILWSNRSSPGVAPAGVYFANEDTGELSIQPFRAIAPMNDASGKPVLVRAFLYSKDGGKTKVAAYYEKYSDDAMKAYADAARGINVNIRRFQTGQLVRYPASGSPWVPADSDAGKMIIASFPTGDNVTPCSVVLPGKGGAPRP